MNSNDVLQRLTECVNNGPVDSIVNSFTDHMYATAVLVYGKNINVQNNFNFTINRYFNIYIKGFYANILLNGLREAT